VRLVKQRPPGFESRELRDLAEIIRSRRTINLFLQTPVPPQLLSDAIEVATWAPNHHVTEPWKFYVLGKETIDRCLVLLREIVTLKKDAKAAEFKVRNWSEKPGWLLVTCARSDDEFRQQEDYAACCAAVQNLLLFLWKAGVGTKWTTGDITRDTRFFDIVDVDAKQEMVVGLIWYGYPKVTPTQSRKNTADVMQTLP
jgi:nitroreductase